MSSDGEEMIIGKPEKTDGENYEKWKSTVVGDVKEDDPRKVFGQIRLSAINRAKNKLREPSPRNNETSLSPRNLEVSMTSNVNKKKIPPKVIAKA